METRCISLWDKIFSQKTSIQVCLRLCGGSGKLPALGRVHVCPSCPGLAWEAGFSGPHHAAAPREAPTCGSCSSHLTCHGSTGGKMGEQELDPARQTPGQTLQAQRKVCGLIPARHLRPEPPRLPLGSGITQQTPTSGRIQVLAAPHWSRSTRLLHSHGAQLCTRRTSTAEHSATPVPPSSQRPPAPAGLRRALTSPPALSCCAQPKLFIAVMDGETDPAVCQLKTIGAWSVPAWWHLGCRFHASPSCSITEPVLPVGAGAAPRPSLSLCTVGLKSPYAQHLGMLAP